MHALLLGTILAGGGSSPAWALAITNATCTQQADNSLRFDCTITTDVASNAFIKFGEDLPAGCQEPRSTPASFNNTSHSFTLYGLKPSDAFEWRGYASPATGGAAVYTNCKNETTGDLPELDGTAELAHVGISTAGAADDVYNFLTHWGCRQPGNVRRDAFIVVDRDGEIVWYQDPAADLASVGSTDLSLEAIGLTRPLKHVLGIINHEIIVEYTLEGELVNLLCRDDGSGYCPGTTTVPDATFDDYVHHDLAVFDGSLYVLTAEEVGVTDLLDCDGDSSTSDTYPIVVDGMYVFDLTSGTPTLSDEWMWTDVAGVTVDYTVAGTCTSSYWGSSVAGADYMHTNSLWVDVAEQWMFSVHNLDSIWMVDADPTSSTYNEVAWTMNGGDPTDTGDSWEMVAGGYDEEFHGQHTAHWGPNADLAIFDNQWTNTGGTGVSRGVVFELDATGGTASATAQYTMEDLAAADIYCPTGSSLWQLLGGHALATCAEVNGTSAAMVNEFDASDSVVWAVELECDAGYQRNGTAFRGYANLW